MLCAAWVATGCSMLSEPGGPDHCSLQAERNGEQPCGEGRRCLATPTTSGDVGECRSVLCAPDDITERGNGLPEQCNGIDDDCDGLVDEGNDWNADGEIQPEESFDRDGDGFTTCGTRPRSEGDGGRPGVSPDLVDCNDMDANVHPGRPGEPAPEEVCDGRDNDCDGLADLVPTSDGGTRPPCLDDGYICDAQRAACIFDCASCPAGYRCDITAEPARCAPGRCDTGGIECPADTFCSSEYGACLRRKPIGERCSVDAECESGVCYQSTLLEGYGLSLSGTVGICSQACCNDRDCASDAVCWAPGNGVRGCIPRALLHGIASPGDPCASSDTCTSLACLPGANECLAPCVHAEGDCPDGSACSIARVGDGGPLRTACFPGDRGEDEPIPCAMGQDCPSYRCTFLGDPSPSGRFLCPAFCKPVLADDDNFVTRCQRDDAFIDAWLGRCVLGFGDQCRPLVSDDEECESNLDCRDQLCEARRCVGRCCRDEDCGSGRICRPRPGPRSPFEMRCTDDPRR